MANINQTVWKILQSDLAIQKDLSREIINMRALAKYILKKYQLKVSLDAVISSIRRFQSQEVFEEEDEQLLTVLKDSLISTKNNVSCVTFGYKPTEVFELLRKLSEKTTRIRLVIGSREVKLFVENRMLDLVKELFGKMNRFEVIDGLAQISIVTKEEVSNIKGVAARITSEVSLANININEMVICQPEFLIYVKEEDTVKAHNSLLLLCSGKRG